MTCRNKRPFFTHVVYTPAGISPCHTIAFPKKKQKTAQNKQKTKHIKGKTGIRRETSEIN